MSGGVSISVDVPGLDELAGRIKNPMRRHAVTVNLLNKIRLQLLRQTMQNAPVKTGTLRRSTTSVINTGTEPWARVGSSVQYSIFVERGTAPHVILPKNVQFLRFVPSALAVYDNPLAGVKGNVRRTGQAKAGFENLYIYSRGVNHPGTKANPYLERAWQEGKSFREECLQVAAQQIAQHMAHANATADDASLDGAF